MVWKINRYRYTATPLLFTHDDMAAEYVWHFLHIGCPWALFDWCVCRFLYHIKTVLILSYTSQQSGEKSIVLNWKRICFTLFLSIVFLSLLSQALTSHDSTRTRIWFPMFSYFESSVDGIIPNEYSSVEDICSELFGCIASLRHCCMLTARRFWLANQQLVSPEFSKKIFPFATTSKAESASTAAAEDDETAKLIDTAQTHPDAMPSNCFRSANRAATEKDINDIMRSNDSSQSFASNNYGDPHTKKYDWICTKMIQTLHVYIVNTSTHHEKVWLWSNQKWTKFILIRYFSI